MKAALGAAALVAVTGASQLASAQIIAGSVRVRTLIDGRSRFAISGNQLWWMHFDYAAPGLHSGNTLPTEVYTSLDGSPEAHVSWCPIWTNGCNTCGGSCGELRQRIDSLPLLISPTFPGGSVTSMTLELLECRWSCAIVQEPAADNGYTAIVELDDNPPGGSAWFDVRLHYRFDGAGGGGGGPADTDGDGVYDTSDNCPATPNTDQADLDGDAEGDACDDDVDGDGVSNCADQCVIEDPMGADADGDGCVDSLEGIDEVVSSAPIPAGAMTSLRAFINAARDAMARGNVNAAINVLNAMMNRVEHNRPRIDPATRDLLIGYIQNIIDSL